MLFNWNILPLWFWCDATDIHWYSSIEWVAFTEGLQTSRLLHLVDVEPKTWMEKKTKNRNETHCADWTDIVIAVPNGMDKTIHPRRVVFSQRLQRTFNEKAANGKYWVTLPIIRNDINLIHNVSSYYKRAKVAVFRRYNFSAIAACHLYLLKETRKSLSSSVFSMPRISSR